MKTIILLAFLFTGLHALETEERIGLDPVLRGVWVLHATSEDGGETTELTDPPKEFAVATATKLKIAGKRELDILSVSIFTAANGAIGNVALLSNGRVLIFTKEPGQGFVLVQCRTEDEEVSRLLIQVKE